MSTRKYKKGGKVRLGWLGKAENDWRESKVKKGRKMVNNRKEMGICCQAGRGGYRSAGLSLYPGRKQVWKVDWTISLVSHQYLKTDAWTRCQFVLCVFNCNCGWRLQFLASSWDYNPLLIHFYRYFLQTLFLLLHRFLRHRVFFLIGINICLPFSTVIALS
jgi:hypothetical protein